MDLNFIFHDLLQIEDSSYKAFGKQPLIMPAQYKQLAFIGDMILVVEDEEKYIFSSRGTQTDKEWAQDFEAAFIPFKYVKDSGAVHKGFQDVYDARRPDLWKLINTLDEKKRFIIQGHSLGGPVATYLAYDLASWTHVIPELVTWASPRSGLTDFRNAFLNKGLKHTRIVNHHDLVPEVPLFPFVHIGPPLKVEGDFDLEDIKIAHRLESYLNGGLKLINQQAKVATV